MTHIKKDALENTVKQCIGDLGLLGQAQLTKELASSKIKDWETYVSIINDCKEELNKSKDKAILGKESTFEETVCDFYILLRSAIAKLENNLAPKSDSISIIEITASIGFLGTKINIDPKVIEAKIIYINNQIDYLAQAIQEVKNPNISSQIKAWFSNLTL